MKQINAVILGASGYTGAELIRFLAPHPHVNIVVLTADSQAGKKVEEIYPHLRMLNLPSMVTVDQVDYKNVDVVFCCLPHGTTQEIIAALPAHVRIVDLSADFRLFNLDAYAQWYGHAHKAPALQKDAVYGLTEWSRDKVKNARLVANPGCYPTSTLLPLKPLLEAKLIAADGIIIDAKSGVSGAGRAAKQAMLYSELTEGMSAYGVGSHRHMPEIEQGLTESAGSDVTISFTPHLIPMSRGMLSTIYVNLSAGKTADDLRDALQKRYANEAFVHVLPAGVTSSTHQVRGSNHCLIGVFADRQKGRAIIVSVIDNLVKGASGQAVQNMNLMFGFPEIMGLEGTAVFP